MRCEGDDGRKFDPDVDLDNGGGGGGGVERLIRSSENGVFCSRLIAGALIDDVDDKGVFAGRGNFMLVDARNRGY
jgi:hypothetical protein